MYYKANTADLAEVNTMNKLQNILINFLNHLAMTSAQHC
jgi:hypothetical protein